MVRYPLTLDRRFPPCERWPCSPSSSPRSPPSPPTRPWSAPRRAAPGRRPTPGKAARFRPPARASRSAPGTASSTTSQSDAAVRSIHVAGTLRFAPDRDTRLDVGLIKIQAGDDASENGFDCDAHVGRARRRRSRGRRWRSARADRPDRRRSTPPLIRLAYVDGHGQGSRARRSSAAAAGWTSTARR